MHPRRILVVSIALIVVALPAFAQTDPDAVTPQQAALACGPWPDADPPPVDALRIRGAQETRATGMYSNRDLLILDGGTNAGVQLGQRFYIRRPIRWGLPMGARPLRASTVGWIRVVAVNDTTAIATVQYACDAILQNDYLAPFVAPVIPAGVERDDATGELDFTTLSRVMVGAENRGNGAAGDLMLMDRGSDEGVAPGARFAIYRDLRVPGMPLAPIGEAVVITPGATTSVVRITRTRDAVQIGDYLVPRK